MHAVICDDEKSTCTQLEHILADYAMRQGVKIRTDSFFSGDVLIDYIKKEETPDILFLDIELPGLNGVAVGDYIRRGLENEQIFLVYISSKERYALQLFKNRPFDFLIKPLNEEKVFPVLENIYRIIGKGNCEFEYQSKGSVYRIPYKNIYYFQSIGRRISIITRQGERTFYGKLADVEAKLPERLFLSIHKSYLVNVNYVQEYTYECVKMVTGDTLTISKANRAAVRRKILEREADECGFRSGCF